MANNVNALSSRSVSQSGIVEQLEEQDLLNNNELMRSTLNRKKALLTRHVKIQEAYWKQKANIQWAKEGDLNTSFFHAVVTGRRRRLTIHRIKTSDDQWIEEEDEIANEAISFYKDLFNQPPEHIDENFWIVLIKL